MSAMRHREFAPTVQSASGASAWSTVGGRQAHPSAPTGLGGVLLQLQRTHGNRYVQRLVGSARRAPVVRPKFVVGPVGDSYEREADRVAQRVVGHTAGSNSDHEAPERATGMPAIQRLHSTDDGTADPAVQQAIQQAQGRGQPLPEHVRTPMEKAMGADLSGVSLHTDAQADQLNRVLQARAFTTGQDVFLRRGYHDLSSRDGQALIAHELTHVLQQGYGSSRRMAGSSRSSRPATPEPTATSGSSVIQRDLFPLDDEGNRFRDSNGVYVTRSETNDSIFIGDKDGLEYRIQGTGDDSIFVLSEFYIQDSPSNSSQPFPWLTPPQTSPLPQQITPTPPRQTTPTSPLQQTTTASAVPPVLNAPAIADYWTSPRGQNTFSFSPGKTPYLRGSASGQYKSKKRRNATGFENPDQLSVPIRPHLFDAVEASGQQVDRKLKGKALETFMNDPARTFKVSSPKRTHWTTITGRIDENRGKSKLVAGHHPDASEVWNAGGHKQARYLNDAHNKLTSTYHGMEDEASSTASGSKAARYLSPRPNLGSDRSYYDPSHSGFTGGPWHTYTSQADQKMINYIEAKLTGAASTSASSADHQQALSALAYLKTNFDKALARQLLGIINKNGW